MKYKVLLVEDDLGLATVLRDFFEENTLNILHAEDGETALILYEKEHPHLILLDVILPGMDGFEVISEIRKKDFYIPIILMTGTEVQPESEIKGYQLGAINYLRKPVLPMVVLALIERLLNRSYATEHYTIGNYHLTLQNQLVKINETSFQLREKDLMVLSLLLKHQNTIVSRQYLLQAVWQNDAYDKNNGLDSAISRIRKAFRPFPEISIKGIYGEGYMLSSD